MYFSVSVTIKPVVTSSKLRYEVGHEAGKQHYNSSLSKLINPS